MLNRFSPNFFVLLTYIVFLTSSHSLHAQQNTAPELTSPLESVYTNTPTYTWVSQASVTDYRLQIYDRLKKAWAFSENVDAGSNCSNGICNFTPDYPLTYSRNHIWRVRGRNATGWGPFSANELFDYLPESGIPSPPALIAPLENIYTNSPTYTWVPQASVTDYRLQIYDRLKKTWAFSETTDTGSVCSNASCSFTPDYPLTYSRNHIWRVRAKNATGWGPFSVNELFDYLPETGLPSAPNLSSPLENAYTNTPSYSWVSQASVTDYRLQIYDRLEKSWSFSENIDAGSHCSNGNCSYTPDYPLDISRNHIWRVRGKNATGWGPFSPNELFSVVDSNDNLPNIVLIISDDHGWSDYGFMDHETINTPHLDHLASESMLYTRGYVPSSVCRPSLATMITGLYPHEHGITSNDPFGGLNTRFDPVARAMMVEVFKNNLTIGEYLSNLGYVSFQSGKWWEGSPTEHGFTEGMTHGVVEDRGRHGDLGLKIGREGMTEVFDFMDSAGDSPFFLWYAPYMPHLPHTPPEDILAKYLADGLPIEVAKYYAMVEWFDDTVGQLVQKIDAIGERENTIIVYVSDNGWVQAQSLGLDTIPQSRSKTSPYDAGIRSPIMLRWASKIQPGRDDTTLVGSIDIVPTILKSVGIEPPPTMQGINLLDAEALQSREEINGAIFSSDAQDIHNPVASLKYRYAVRRDGWKLVLPYTPNREVPLGPTGEIADWMGFEPELYNVLDDPFEDTNLAASNPDLVQDMIDNLNFWWETYD